MFSLIALHLIFETKISYWTWGSSAWLGSLSSELRGASASSETRFTARLQASGSVRGCEESELRVSHVCDKP